MRARRGKILKDYRSNGSAASSSTVLGKGLLGGLGAVASIRHIVLGLPVLGQVEGGDLLGLLNLLLVGLDLALELVDQSLHSLVVLPVLVLLVGQLLDPALRLPHVLLSIALAPVLSIKLRLKFPDPCVHLGHGLLASLEGLALSIVDTGLHVLDLGLEQLALPLKSLGTVLLSAELVCEPSNE